MLAPDALLETTRGPVPAQAVREGEAVRLLGARGPGLAPPTAIRYRACPGELIHLETAGGRTLAVTPDQPLFTRFGPGPPPWDVILVKEVGLGAALLRGRGGLRDLGDVSFSYSTCAKEEVHTEHIYLLGSYTSEDEAWLHQKLWAARFGIPETDGGYRDLDRDAWRRLFLEVDTLGRAYDLLDALGLEPDHPHWVRRTLDRARFRKHLLVEATEREGLWDLRIRRPDPQATRSRGTQVPRDPQRVADLSSYEGLGHVDLDRRVDLGARSSFRRLSAAGVHRGMLVPAVDAGRIVEDRVLSTRRLPARGLVYRVDTPEALGLVVDGVVVAAHLGAGAGSARPEELETEHGRRPPP